MTSTKVRRKVLLQMAGGVGVLSIPIGVWWYNAVQERNAVQEAARTAVRIPGGVSNDTFDYLITEKCKPGDVILFDRRCERCVSPWAALACIVSKQLGMYNHCGLIVPGYIKTKADQFDPTNLLLLEATASGIVARNLKERLEQSASNSILLLQVCTPGERRDQDDQEQSEYVNSTRIHVARELAKFRDHWIAAGEKQHYKHLHSTVTIGGGLSSILGISDYIAGPVSPAAYFTLTGLQQAAIAVKVMERAHRQTIVPDFLRDYRYTDVNSVRLRPGFRFLPPITLKQGNSL